MIVFLLLTKDHTIPNILLIGLAWTQFLNLIYKLKIDDRREEKYFLVVDAFYEADLSPVMHINVYRRVYTRSAE